MTGRQFQMRLTCRYEGTDNAIKHLEVESLEEGQWQGFELNALTPGFLIFVYALLTCQHLYLRSNAGERGLIVDTAQGSIHVVAGEDWDLEVVRVHFKAQLRTGSPNPGDVEYIVGRMKACPVSRNIKSGPVIETSVHFV